jgi:anti-sigma regulatory factor (Ser/Thr protein kinase)
MADMRGRFCREIAALDEIFRFVAEFVGAAEIDERTAFILDLVVEELFTNIVRHNDRGGDTVDLNVDLDDGAVHVELVDHDAEPFDPASVPPPPVTAGIGERRPGGLGLHLVRSMVDGLDYDYEPETRRMRVSVTKRLER